MLPSYNFAPAPSSYSGTFGGVPGVVAPAPSIWEQSLAAVPSLPQLGSNVSSVIQGKLAGQLSPQTINAIKDQSAAWGVSSGMPGSGIAGNLGLRDLGLATEGVQSQGVDDYLKFLGGVGAQQTNPAVNDELAQWNATNRAAPNPAQAEQFLMSLLHPSAPGGTGTGVGGGNYFTPAGSDTHMPYASAFA